ncbi:hypothetical protein KUV98_03955 [Mameliella alba]|nr:hypothetical protein [Mameliella alba]MBY6168478.1 hypothetical protein [Mameliella alba]
MTAPSRTTAALISNAIAATRSAGIEIGAVEVAPGGLVRILARGTLPTLSPAPEAENSCDSVFGEAVQK